MYKRLLFLSMLALLTGKPTLHGSLDDDGNFAETVDAQAAEEVAQAEADMQAAKQKADCPSCNDSPCICNKTVSVPLNS
ncbi:hypothetical protein FJ364_04910 [Candidatus Dependentiae bacterium]|nr:hypothetical protein [Candidatus Dependentiae bacterium]